MARPNRHHIPKEVWHNTHRCHKKEFLLNMVGNGAVQHPSAWQHGGYNEIQDSPRRYGLINREKLIACCGLSSDTQFRKYHREWTEEAIIFDGSTRQAQWSESLAVGSE